VVRSFSGFAAALDEIKNARVFGGIHFRTACNDGTALGSAIGNYVIHHAPLPNHRSARIHVADDVDTVRLVPAAGRGRLTRHPKVEPF
jgi:hypothetical protein